MPPPLKLAKLFVMRQLVIVGEEEYVLQIPLPIFAVFFVIMQLIIEGEEFSLYIPPP